MPSNGFSQKYFKTKLETNLNSNPSPNVLPEVPISTTLSVQCQTNSINMNSKKKCIRNAKANPCSLPPLKSSIFEFRVLKTRRENSIIDANFSSHQQFVRSAAGRERGTALAKLHYIFHRDRREKSASQSLKNFTFYKK